MVYGITIINFGLGLGPVRSLSKKLRELCASRGGCPPKGAEGFAGLLVAPRTPCGSPRNVSLTASSRRPSVGEVPGPRQVRLTPLNRSRGLPNSPSLGRFRAPSGRFPQAGHGTRVQPLLNARDPPPRGGKGRPSHTRSHVGDPVRGATPGIGGNGGQFNDVPGSWKEWAV